MNHRTYAWDRSRSQLRQEERWRENFCCLGLLVAALLLFGLNLGNLPLLEAEEIIAQVAREIDLHSLVSDRSLFLTWQGQPYLQQPPLVPGLIALVQALLGTNAWTARLSGALLAAVSVFLLYRLGREVFVRRLPALYAALVYLTLLPVVRYGRLATGDGILLCGEILMIGCILRSRRDLRWSLWAGLSFSILALTDGLIGVIITSLSIIFLAWDTPRLLKSFYFWWGLGLGSAPALAWYLSQWLRYGQKLWQEMWLHPWQEGWNNFWGVSWFHWLELLKYSWPWLIFMGYGLYLACRSLNWSWARLILTWGGIYLVVISLLPFPQISYAIAVYPPLALAAGISLAEVQNLPSDRPYPKLWMIALMGLCAGVSLVCLVNLLVLFDHPLLILILAALALTLGTSSILLARQNPQFTIILLWGMYVSLVLLVSSPYWLGAMSQ